MGEATREDLSYMGTFETAEDDFLCWVDKWTELRQPLIASAREHRKRESQEQEALFRLGNAAALYAWHIRHKAQKV